MGFKSIIISSITIILSFILGSVVTIFFKPLADKKIEKCRKKLNTYELISKKQLESADKFSEFYENLLSKKTHPDMEWEEAMEEMIFKSNSYLDFLTNFLASYRVCFDKDILDLLENCKNKASYCRDVLMEMNDPGEIYYSYKSGEDFYNCIKETYEYIKNFTDKKFKI